MEVALAHRDDALGMRRDHRANDLRTRLLIRLVHVSAAQLGKQRLRGRHLEAVAGKIDVVRRFALPDGEDHVDGFGEQLIALLHGEAEAERFGVGRERPGADAENEAALCKMIEHRRVRRDERRMAVREVRRPGAELDGLRVADQRGEEDKAVGHVLAAVGEVLADEGVVKAEPVREDNCLAVFLQGVHRIALRRVHRHHEKAQPHSGSIRAAIFAASVPMIPFAPGLLSTTTAWRVCVCRYCAKVRAVMSPEPPGPKGTIISTGLAGYGCAAAGNATPSGAIQFKSDFMQLSGAELGTIARPALSGIFVLCKLRCMLRALGFLAACALALEAGAQAFPSKPLRLVVGYPPGGSGDFLTRLIADEMSRDLGTAVIVDNRPGAGGNIAAEVVARAPADGYTVLDGNNHAINRTLYRSLPYDDKDFVPITKVATGKRSVK